MKREVTALAMLGVVSGMAHAQTDVRITVLSIPAISSKRAVT
ncbi:hypothetical protein [Oxalobacter paraformigenes]|uniref:Uncharacterized protein n=1 Tax=Oxalobacter paraformigenes TaxID=556268 RepID=T5LUY8_9BURK|nr:hypothetical protein [Oxalobacter paraformigenes]EQM95303.1 hypothetical protein OFAG_02134 [Oxalobacter paraformigenes]